MQVLDEAGSGKYAWDNSWVEARRRLQLIEQCWDPWSHHALGTVGVQPGWRCLEVGGGAGSITRWLLDAVGPDGTVVAVDLDTRFLAEIDAPNLEVIEADIVTDGLPAGPFDFIHTRAVLMHIPARDRLVPELVARLRPGGTILLEECDFHSFEMAGSPQFRGCLRAFGEILHRAAGMDPCWARGMAAQLAGLGLTGVRSWSTASIFPGGSPEAEFLRLSWIQARELLVANGADKEQFQELAELLDDDTEWLPGPAVVAAIGRRPAAN
jgi:SAM-dependent methyltransferase